MRDCAFIYVHAHRPARELGARREVLLTTCCTDYHIVLLYVVVVVLNRGLFLDLEKLLCHPGVVRPVVREGIPQFLQIARVGGQGSTAQPTDKPATVLGHALGHVSVGDHLLAFPRLRFQKVVNSVLILRAAR